VDQPISERQQAALAMKQKPSLRAGADRLDAHGFSPRFERRRPHVDSCGLLKYATKPGALSILFPVSRPAAREIAGRESFSPIVGRPQMCRAAAGIRKG
jgi:hypothetical protein